jgi:hypothetical protein
MLSHQSVDAFEMRRNLEGGRFRGSSLRRSVQKKNSALLLYPAERQVA